MAVLCTNLCSRNRKCRKCVNFAIIPNRNNVTETLANWPKSKPDLDFTRMLKKRFTPVLITRLRLLAGRLRLAGWPTVRRPLLSRSPVRPRRRAVLREAIAGAGRPLLIAAPASAARRRRPPRAPALCGAGRGPRCPRAATHPPAPVRHG